jgi:hypothetical protein
MTKRLIFIITIIASLLYDINGQFISNKKEDVTGGVQNNALGISFAKVGEVTQLDSSSYNINLLSSGTYSAGSAFAQVSAASRLFVDLPGSYGGRLYLDSPNAERLLQNRIMKDSFISNQLSFHRDYWAVYAGMGMWDCVINCYMQKSGQYYIISLIQEKQIGKPGEIVNGKPLKAEDLKLKVVFSLQDSTDTAVQKFNKLLSSFQIQN